MLEIPVGFSLTRWNMFSFRGSCCTLGCAIVCFLVAATACHPAGQAPAGNTPSLTEMTPAAPEEVEKGFDSSKNEAIAHFQKAVELDPNSILAKVYLGFALSEDVVPGMNSPDNLKAAQQAIDIYLQASEEGSTPCVQYGADCVDLLRDREILMMRRRGRRRCCRKISKTPRPPTTSLARSTGR